MTLPTYASTGLPNRPLVDSWEQPDLYQDPIITDMEGGNKRLRRRPGDDVEMIQFEMNFTKAQYATFKAFVRDTLFNGTSRFTMNVWMGNAMESRRVQFAQKPSMMNEHPIVRVKFQLWVYANV
jgi:hypothetical protein